MATSGAPLVPRIAGTSVAVRPAALSLARRGLRQAAAVRHRVPCRRAPGERRAGARRVLADLRRGARLGREPEHRRTSGSAAMLALLGSVGLMVHAHEAMPELAASPRCAALSPCCRTRTRSRCPRACCSAWRWAAPRSPAVGRRGLAAGRGAARAPRLPGMAPPQRGFISHGADRLAFSIAASWPLALRGVRPRRSRCGARRPGSRSATGANLRYFLVTGSWFAWPGWPLALWACGRCAGAGASRGSSCRRGELGDAAAAATGDRRRT